MEHTYEQDHFMNIADVSSVLTDDRCHCFMAHVTIYTIQGFVLVYSITARSSFDVIVNIRRFIAQRIKEVNSIVCCV